MKRLTTALLLLAALTTGAKQVTVTSPNGRLTATIADGPMLSLTVSQDGQQLLQADSLMLSIKTANGRTLTSPAKIGSVKQSSADRTFSPVVNIRQKTIRDNYREALITLKGGFTLRLRVMDNAVAYRFATTQKGVADVESEYFAMRPTVPVTSHRQTAGSFNTSFEERYQHQEGCTFDGMATVPLLLSGADDLQLLIGETDVDDYPHMFFGSNGGSLHPIFPKAPLKWEPKGDRSETITEEADAIAAHTAGTRDYPWRWVIVTNSKGLAEQTVPIQLARRPALSETSWIRPGRVSWEWWNGAAPYGPDVTFRVGNNFDTYRYFIDFAAQYGLEYILLDEGWAKDTRDPFIGKDDLRLPELISYGKSRGVGIILWLPWLTTEQHFDLFETYEKWGVAGVKIDFMDHGDQWMTNFYKRVVQEAARHHLVVDFHGAFPPAGLEHEYPNLLSYEGVRGMEYMGGCVPENTIWQPFMRNTLGAMDYTPGAMLSMQPELYRAERPNAASIGTRAYQLALFVVFESGVQMLADNPTLYRQNDDCTRFIASVPVTWDETRIVAAEAGKYIVTAKRKGDTWFVGAINGQQQAQQLHLSLSFLDGTQSYEMKAFADGVNANYQAMHYTTEARPAKAGDEIDIRMERNGGWAARFTSKQE